MSQTPNPELLHKEIARRVLSRRHLLPFIEKFNSDYQSGWVHKDICERLERFSEAVEQRKSPRLMLFMPPRHGKSTISSVNYPAWHLGKYPHHEFIGCSYSGSLMNTFSRKIRALIRDPAYTAIFPESQLDPDSQSVEAWLMQKGGGFVAAGVGGGITGKGAHILVIDDPVRNREDAESETGRQSTYDWYTSTAYTRLAPGGGVLLILTRWHDDDLAGRLISDMQQGGDEWEIIRYPAIAVEDEPYRKQGEPLHPDRYDEKALARIAKAIGPRDWAALYQQDPVAEDGAYFVKSMIRYFDSPPTDDKLVKYAAWDLAIGRKETNDYSVGIVVGIDRDENMYILHLERGRWDGYEIVEKMLDMQEAWRPVMTGVEKGHIEMAIGPFLDKRIAERRMYSSYFRSLPTGRRDKELRARAIQARMAQGKVFFPSYAMFTDTLINELLRFPSGKHDDMVDALAWIGLMINEYITVPEVKRKHPSWRDNLAKFISHGPSRRSPMSA